MTSIAAVGRKPAMPSLALTLAAAAAAAGCASAPPPRPAAAQPSAGQARAAAIAAAQRLLTDDVAALRQKWELNLGQQRSVAGCMHRLGYRYLVPSPGPQPRASIVTADVAGPPGRASYRVPLHAGGRRADAEDGYLRRLPAPQRARYSAALLGTRGEEAAMRIPGGGTVTYGTGGCLGAARRQQFGSLPAFVLDSYLPQVAGQQFGSYLAGYRPYTLALSRWRRCMASAGHRFTSPAAALESVEALAARGQTSARALAADQRAVAGADAACGERSGLRHRRHDGLLAWLHTQPSAALTQLRSVYLTRQRAVAAAKRDQGAAATPARGVRCR
jgi:hypothetical protein